MKDIVEKAKKIKLVVFDVDGVLTDGSLILGESGNEYKIFNVKDGHGMVMLLNSGINIAIITARSSKIVSERMAALGIKYLYQGQNDKGQAMRSLLKELDLTREVIAYAGDDLIDLPAMQHAGLTIAVADAHPLIIKHADWTTSAKGGHGAVREICELIMQAQGSYEKQIDQYLDKISN